MNQHAANLDAALGAAVERAAPSVVRIQHGRRATSGFVFREPNLVLTSSAYLRRCGEVRVADHDGNHHSAELLGRTAGTDVAVLRVEGELPPLEFRGTNGLMTGNLCLALGRPGRAIRASLRIIGVLADGIDTPRGGHLDRYVETDRGLPMGFAGGPLLDLGGEAIGLNTDAILRGADLAVPQPTLEQVVDAIVSEGGVKRGYLGISVRPVHLPKAIQDAQEQKRGALIIAVEEGSPAEASGLTLGDTFLTIGDDPITGPRSLASALRGRPSEKVKATILRAGTVTEIEIETGERL
ncbi:MAG: trypsin-like peptidase domain-containing protein [Myxococcota bacterium]